MISVTNDYLNQLNNNSLTPKSKIIVDGVEYLGNIIKETPKIKHSATKPFGTFPAKTLSFSIYDLNNNIDFEDKEIEVYKGLVIDGEIEYAKQGIFIPTAENISTNITERTVSFSDVQDRTQLLMDKYESELDWSNGQTHTGLEIIREICTKKNITLKTTNFAFANYQFKQPNFNETITNRGVIASMGEIGGETVIFDYNGELEIKSQNNTNHIIQRKRYEKLCYEKAITFNTVVLGREGVNNDIVYPSEIETVRVEAKILDNPFVDLYREEMIEEVARHIIGFSYIPFNIENMVDGYIYELNDVVEAIDKNNNSFEAVLLSIENNTRIKSNISAPQLEENKTNYNLAGSNKQQINQVKLDVDHNNQRIEAVAIQANNNTSQISSLTMKTDGIETSVQAVREEGEENYTRINQDINEINTSIQTAGGVNLLLNSVMFAHDDNGIQSWEITGNGIIDFSDSSASVLAGGVSGHVFVLNDKKATQRVKVKIDSDDIPENEKTYYTFSTKIKKDINGTCYVKIFNSNEEHIISIEQGENPYYADYEIKALLPKDNYYDIEFYGSNGSNATFTDNMFTIGNYKKQWTQANGEIINTQVNLGMNGVSVKSATSEGTETNITPFEFAGYTMINGVRKKVFTLNGDTTEVEKIKSSKEINMPPLKIVPITSGTRKGWAFVPTGGGN